MGYHSKSYNFGESELLPSNENLSIEGDGSITIVIKPVAVTAPLIGKEIDAAVLLCHCSNQNV